MVRLPLPMEPRHFCVSSDGGELFLSGDGMDAVVIVFPYSTEIWQTVLAGRAPGVLALTESPSLLLVANPETNSLTVLDGSQRLVALVEVGEQPSGLLLTPDQQYVLVLNEKSGDLAVVRTYSLRVAKAWHHGRPLPFGSGFYHDPRRRKARQRCRRTLGLGDRRTGPRSQLLLLTLGCDGFHRGFHLFGIAEIVAVQRLQAVV